MMNFYTLEVYAKQRKPCFVVTICCELYAGVMFFNTLEKAKEYIKSQKIEFFDFGYDLQYNPEGNTDEGFANIIKIVLSCETIKIGENGRTYFED